VFSCVVGLLVFFMMLNCYKKCSNRSRLQRYNAQHQASDHSVANVESEGNANEQEEVMYGEFELIEVENEIGYLGQGEGERVDRPLNEREIHKFKVEELEERKEVREKLCSICTEDFVGDWKVVRFRCGHFFHARCIKVWLTVRASCPNCRAAIRET